MNKIEQLKQTVEDLKAAKQLISTHQKWTKGTYARNNKGELLHEQDFDACRFCSVGAVAKVTNHHFARYHDATNYLDQVAGENYSFDIMDLNDSPSTKHSGVMHAFDLAIFMAEDDLEVALKSGGK